MQQRSFEAEVLDALRARVETYEIRPGLGSFNKGFTLNAVSWRVDVREHGASMSVTDMQTILSPYLRAINPGSMGGVLLVTRHDLPAESRQYLDSLTYTVEHCTLDSLYNKLLALGLKSDETPTSGSENGAVAVSEAQDDYPGRVVIIDRSSLKYRELIAALEAVADELRTSNSLALRSDERDRSLAEVRSGRALFDADTVRPEAVRSVLAGPLKRLSQLVAQVAVKELALRAWQKLIEFLPFL